MFKNFIAYRIAPLWPADLGAIEQALTKGQFTPCGATQASSIGFVPPRGEENGALIESIAGQWILRFKSETKTIPAQALARRVAEKAARIEQETGRKPGRKETKELKDEARLDLLPMAFSNEATTWVWIDRECELKSADESKATVRYGRHPLDIEEVQKHIAAGKLPTRLAMTWDDRVSFVLTQGLQVRGVKFLDAVFEGTEADAGGFDADVTIATGELRKLIPDLVDALGGEAKAQECDAE